jgi:hypothetical protein
MGKEDTVRLPGINQPGDLPVIPDIFVDENFFILGYALHICVTFNTLIQFRGTGIGTIITEKMAALATVQHHLTVKGVVEIKRLLLLAIQYLWEKNPPYQKAHH